MEEAEVPEMKREEVEEMKKVKSIIWRQRRWRSYVSSSAPPPNFAQPHRGGRMWRQPTSHDDGMRRVRGAGWRAANEHHQSWSSLLCYTRACCVTLYPLQ